MYTPSLFNLLSSESWLSQKRKEPLVLGNAIKLLPGNSMDSTGRLFGNKVITNVIAWKVVLCSDMGNQSEDLVQGDYLYPQEKELETWKERYPTVGVAAHAGPGYSECLSGHRFSSSLETMPPCLKRKVNISIGLYLALGWDLMF